MGEKPLPRGRGALPPEVVQASQRRRLLRAMGTMVSKKGIVELTVADLVTEAGVGRKSFYAIWSDKTECYIEGYLINAQVLLDAMADAMAAEGDAVDRLLDGFRAYLRVLDQNPVLARAYLLESMRAGPEMIKQRDRIHKKFEQLVRDQYRRARKEHPQLADASENAIVGLIGGINELVERELARGVRKADVASLEPDVEHLAVSILGLDRALTRQEV